MALGGILRDAALVLVGHVLLRASDACEAAGNRLLDVVETPEVEDQQPVPYQVVQADHVSPLTPEARAMLRRHAESMDEILPPPPFVPLTGSLAARRAAAKGH